MTKHEFFRTVKGKDSRKVDIAIGFDKRFELSEKMVKYLEKEMVVLAAWVLRNIKEK